MTILGLAESFKTMNRPYRNALWRLISRNIKVRDVKYWHIMNMNNLIWNLLQNFHEDKLLYIYIYIYFLTHRYIYFFQYFFSHIIGKCEYILTFFIYFEKIYFLEVSCIFHSFRVSEANEEPISSHICIALTSFKQL